MNSLTNHHLNEEQLYTALDTPSDHSVQSHLSTCTACQSELAAIRTSLVNFRIATTKLAAAQPPRSALTRPVRYSRSGLIFKPQAWAASFATVAALLALSVSLLHPSHRPTTPAAKDQMPQAASESDEALLDGIQRDLATSIPPSLAPLALQPGSDPASRHN